MSTSTSYMQGLAALFILIVSLVVQLTFNPYENRMLNIMEATGLLVSTMTLYVGLWTFERDSVSKDRISLVATIIVFVINIAFLVMVARVMGATAVRRVKKKLGFAPKEIEASGGIEITAPMSVRVESENIARTNYTVVTNPMNVA